MSLSPVSDYGDLLTVEEFYDMNRDGMLLQYDGTGCWATKDHYASDTSVFKNKRPKWATHVLWFNC